MSQKHFLAGIAFGAVVGAGLAYIFGTDQGKKLQKDIKKKGKLIAENMPEIDDIVDKAQDVKEDFKDQAKETIEAFKDTVSQASDALKEKFEEPISLPPKPRFFKKSN
jgi:gas vesicle protein